MNATAFRNDGTTPVTQEELNDHQTYLRSVASGTAVDLVQSTIDGNEKFNDYDITVAADIEFTNYVVVTFPTDASTPKFWSAAASRIVLEHFGTYFDGVDHRSTEETTTPYIVRQDKDMMVRHLTEISLGL